MKYEITKWLGAQIFLQSVPFTTKHSEAPALCLVPGPWCAGENVLCAQRQ